MYSFNNRVPYLLTFLVCFSFLQANFHFDPNFVQKFTQKSRFYIGEQNGFRPEYLLKKNRFIVLSAQKVKASSFNQSWLQLLAQGNFDALKNQASKLEKLIGSKSWHVKKIFFPAWTHQQQHAYIRIKKLLLSDKARALEKIKHGSIREAKKEIAELENSWPYNQQIICTVTQRKQIDKHHQLIGFNELEAAQALFKKRDDYALLESPIDQQIVTILKHNSDSNKILKALRKQSNKIISCAEQNKVVVHQQIKDRLAWATDITNLSEPGDFVFKIATVEHLLNDITDMACDGQAALQEQYTNLLVRGLSKYFEYLSGPTETEISLIFDIARYISDVTIGACYLSPKIYTQRVAHFWHKWQNYSFNSSELLSEQILDSAAYIAARATHAMGTWAIHSVVKNIKNVSATAARSIALFAERFMQGFNSFFTANPAVIVNNEGAFIWNASELAAAEARQLVRAFDGIKDKGSTKPSAEILDDSKKGVESESKIKIKTVDDLIKEATLGRKTHGKVNQYEKKGVYCDAMKDFKSLHPKNVVDISQFKDGSKLLGQLEDGTIVMVRNVSSRGRDYPYGCSTLEIKISKNNIIKFRYL